MPKLYVAVYEGDPMNGLSEITPEEVAALPEVQAAVMKDLGLKGICQWIIASYPKDIFRDKPLPIVIMREQAEEILKSNLRYGL